MAIREVVLYMLKVNQQALKQLIDDITEDESLARGANKGNHIRWLTGYLICYDSYALTLLGDRSEDYKEFLNLFGARTEISDDPSVYPPMAELKQFLYKTYEEEIKLLEGISAIDLKKEIGEKEEKQPIWQALAFYCLHDFYHAGQITAIRRALGRARPFV
jgi:hypothetical protein